MWFIILYFNFIFYLTGVFGLAPEYYHFHNKPRLQYPNENGHLTWYPIGFSGDFNCNKKQVTIRDINYIVWKTNNKYYGVRDCCSHQGSSFINGRSFANTIMCPYHGYIFDGNDGKLIKIPKTAHEPCEQHNIDAFKVVEKGDVVYLNTIPLHEIGGQSNLLEENQIFIEPEFYDKSHKPIYLDKEFNHYAKLVSVNSLDICHIGFVHTFGNKQQPNPLNDIEVRKVNDTDNHYKVLYNYIAGKKSIVSKIYKMSNIWVENEYVLPHTTVARVQFDKWSSTIVTHALPISTKLGSLKTKLFVKAYRNYMYYDVKNIDMIYPLKYLVNTLGNSITLSTMMDTLNQDKAIIDNIDKYSYESMHGKFSVYYDMLSDHYKKNYNLLYETGPNMI
jgi:phenylpropionate dioxygenase-like ring-hydroxylating dioxygenase large terminal subunit